MNEQSETVAAEVPVAPVESPFSSAAPASGGAPRPRQQPMEFRTDPPENWPEEMKKRWPKLEGGALFCPVFSGQQIINEGKIGRRTRKLLGVSHRQYKKLRAKYRRRATAVTEPNDNRTPDAGPDQPVS